MDEVDCVVVGAGVVGLAIARALALSGREVIVLEAADTFGSETSSRNSEVIHAGIYYPAGSLKATLCVQGKHMLYDYCERRHVPYRRCGKLIVATDKTQLAELEALRERGLRNGVDDLYLISAAEAIALEPALACRHALVSPSTGIIDSHSLMVSLLADAEAADAMLAVCSPVVGGEITDDGVVVRVGGDEATVLKAKLFINSAGLHAPALAGSLAGFPRDKVPTAYYAKGSYFTLSGRAPFNRLIYPVPAPGGLGVHLTIDLGGQARFGPNVKWVDRPDYQVDPQEADVFYDEVRRYWPGLADGALQPGYAGVRPKISGPGQPAADFMIQGPRDHGVPGIVNLFGMESPALTASLAVGKRVAQLLNLTYDEV